MLFSDAHAYSPIAQTESDSDRELFGTTSFITTQNGGNSTSAAGDRTAATTANGSCRTDYDHIRDLRAEAATAASSYETPAADSARTRAHCDPTTAATAPAAASTAHSVHSDKTANNLEIDLHEDTLRVTTDAAASVSGDDSDSGSETELFVRQTRPR